VACLVHWYLCMTNAVKRELAKTAELPVSDMIRLSRTYWTDIEIAVLCYLADREPANEPAFLAAVRADDLRTTSSELEAVR
jgi:hypothetical protein